MNNGPNDKQDITLTSLPLWNELGFLPCR